MSFLMPLRLLAVLSFAFILLNCAGSRGTVKFDDIKVRVSSSSYLEIQDQNLNFPDKLQSITRFSYSKRIWGLLYTGLTLSSTDEFARELNATVEQNKADGVVNFTAEVEPCAINSFPLLNMIPLFPGCTIFTIQGELVRKK